MSYTGIQHYGLIGNMRTAALVSRTGSIDWLCLPKFDSPSVFAAILDERIGGRFSITSAEPGCRYKQYYWAGTNILITQFLHPSAIAELQDYMPVCQAAGAHGDLLIRRLKVLRGEIKFKIECRPAFDYARGKHRLTATESAFVFENKDLTLSLACDVSGLSIDGDSITGEFSLQEGNSAIFALKLLNSPQDDYQCPDQNTIDEGFDATTAFWRGWLSKCNYTGRWREAVERSALALKLLTYEPTGAIIAAPTTSLPEALGHERNWDYRYVWIRDAAFTVYSLLKIGFREEAVNFMKWVMQRLEESQEGNAGPLRTLYTIDGSAEIEECQLKHLEGYKGSRPVRTGNGAVKQLQLDIYGELMDSLYLCNEFAAPLSFAQWTKIYCVMEWLCDNWRRDDAGIWEVRNGAHQVVYSKYMCWVALDKALRLSARRSFPGDVSKWRRTRDDIYHEVMKKGWNEKVNSFTQTFGSDLLDASSLLMPIVNFIAGSDPRMLATIEAICKPLQQGGLLLNNMVYRYSPLFADDGLSGEEGRFNMCSFWLVEALTRAGRIDPARAVQARGIFEHMLACANHLGLYSEQTAVNGDMLGNFPQALTHLSLISAACNLDELVAQKDQPFFMQTAS